MEQNNRANPSPPPPYNNMGNNVSAQSVHSNMAQMQQQQQQQQYYVPQMQQRPSHTKQSRAKPVTPIEVATGRPKDDKHTVVAMVVDRSGSMASMKDEVYGGCNAYLEEQRKSDTEDGAHSSIIFTRFDNYAETLHDGVPLSSLPPITAADVQPRGSTALYDAIGETLTKTATFVNKMEKMPGVVIFILTDGHENASQRWTKEAITTEIKRLQEEHIGWDFYFAAANQDGMAEGAKLGMDMEQCTTYAMETGKMAYAMKSSNNAYQRKKKGLGKGYLEFERANMM